MHGDLSLSQSLGGLRIANPDHDRQSSPAPTSEPEPEPVPAPAPTPSPANDDNNNNNTTNSPALRSAPPSAHSPALSSPASSNDTDTRPALCSPDSFVDDDNDDQRLQHHPTLSSHSSGSTITEQQRPRGLSEISSASSSYRSDYGVIRSAPMDSYGQARQYRAHSGDSDQLSYTSQPRLPQSMPVPMPFDQQSQYSQSSQYGARVRPSISHQSSSSRPMSAMYNHQNVSSSSGISQTSYRYRDDIPPPAPVGVSRSASRAAAASAMAAHIPSRTASRSYRGDPQMQMPSPAPINGMPPRRSSKRVPSGSPYALEGGPMPSSEEWKERGAAVSTRQEMDLNGRPVSKVIKKGVKDFNFGRTLGEGSYSTVLAATDRISLREYAVKVLDKRHIIKEKKVKYVNIEKDALNRLTEHPGIVRLYYTFQDERSLYFVLDLANGGELLGVLKRMTTFDEECTRFYAAQILDSIAYMHSRGIIHRDLKPENVLLDEQMHTKITDFGTAKILDLNRLPDGGGSGDTAGDPMDGVEQDRAKSFVGTAEYVSPELLTDKNACKASDLWAFGCIVYQLLAGRPPFKAGNEYQTFQKIVALDYVFPEGFPPIARDLVERLLVLDPNKRLPMDHIMSHPFFDGISWGKSLWKQKAPRLRSYVPPASAPISLNGSGAAPAPGIPTALTSSPGHSGPLQQQQQAPQQIARPQLRAITEVPPPSQLDIDWSPVLTRNNERILKLGNLNVLSAPAPHSPSGKSGDASAEAPKKFSRFFGGSNTKKRQRLVMITSSAHIVIAEAGGDVKKAKLDINLLTSGTSWKSFQDAKGLTAWCIDTRDKHFSFEDPRATTSDPDGSKYSTQEWLECIERAKEIAMSQSMANSYSGDSQYNDLNSAMSSPTSNNGGDGTSDLPMSLAGHSGRNTLRKEQGDNESVKSRKPRFSKRHSKNGLAAVF
ncbi:hypothetical protein MBLNU459_g7238t1 [Dothideomycetes sp. NU459]